MRYHTNLTFSSSTGQLTTAAEVQSGASSAFTFAYINNSSFPDTITWGGTTNFIRDHGYEAYRNLQSSIANKIGTTSIASYSYGRDDMGRSEYEVGSGSIFNRYQNDGLVILYKNSQGGSGYNARGELVGAYTYNGTNPSSPGTELTGRSRTFGYDSAGNRNDHWKEGQHFYNYSRNSENEVTGYTVPGYAAISGFANADKVFVNETLTGQQGDHFFYSESVSNSTAKVVDLDVVAAQIGGGTGGLDLFDSTSESEYVAKASKTIAHDESGNRKDDGLWAYVFDGENRLIQMESTGAAQTAGVTKTRLNFTYDSKGHRVRKLVEEDTGGGYSVIDDKRFIYDAFNVLAVLDSSGAVKQTFHWSGYGPGGLLSMTDTSTSKTYLAGYDGRGNLTVLIDSSDGSIDAAYEYSPFGEVVRATGTFAETNPIGFSSNYTDRETDLVYYGLRFYMPSEGRFINRDPIGEAGGNNLYAAFGGDPINRWDRFGLDFYEEGEEVIELSPFVVSVEAGSRDPLDFSGHFDPADLFNSFMNDVELRIPYLGLNPEGQGDEKGDEQGDRAKAQRGEDPFPCDSVKQLLEDYKSGVASPEGIIEVAAEEAAIENDPWTGRNDIQDAISPGDDFFARVEDPSFFDNELWHHSVTFHGSEAWETAPLVTSLTSGSGSSKFTVKRYADWSRGSTIAVTTWTESFQHYKDAFSFTLQQWGLQDGSINVDNGAAYLQAAYDANCE